MGRVTSCPQPWLSAMTREMVGLRHPHPNRIYCSSLLRVLPFRRHSRGPVSLLFKQWEISNMSSRATFLSGTLCRTPSSSFESCSLPHLHGIASLTFLQLGSLQTPHSASFINNASGLSSSPLCPACLYFLTVIKKPKFCFSLAFCDSSGSRPTGACMLSLMGL